MLSVETSATQRWLDSSSHRLAIIPHPKCFVNTQRRLRNNFLIKYWKFVKRTFLHTNKKKTNKGWDIVYHIILTITSENDTGKSVFTICNSPMSISVSPWVGVTMFTATNKVSSHRTAKHPRLLIEDMTVLHKGSASNTLNGCKVSGI